MSPSMLSSRFRCHGLPWLVLAAPAALAAQQAKSGTVIVTVALVAEELRVRPVPLFQIELVSAADTSTKITLRTDLEGKARQAAPAGEYRVRSVVPARLAGKAYSWSVPASVAAAKILAIELTNTNASVDSSAAEAVVGARQMAPEVAVYERVRRGVVLVSAGLRRGSGFLIDTLGGLVVTNSHVVEGEHDVSVMVDSATRLPAQVVVRDHDADLALLRFALSACPGCGRLQLATPEAGGVLVVPGERVLAIGYPLHQTAAVTAGIVSSVRERAIISDVRLNPGNSGGPLLSVAGLVIAVNTFIDQGKSGPGISGSTVITQLAPLLTRAADTLKSLAPPGDVRLPVLAGPPYPLAVLRGLADTASFKAYEHFDDIGAGSFEVSVFTPVAQFVWLKEFERQISKDRRKREAQANLSEEERYSEFVPYRDWVEYVGDATEPAVVISIAPKRGETGGSFLRRGLIGGHATIKFKGDLEAARILRNGEAVTPAVGGRDPMRVFVENQAVQMKDVAYRGYYAFPPELLAPDSTGAPPSIMVNIQDLKHPEDHVLLELSAELVARAWNDFGPYYGAVHPAMAFVVADPLKFKSLMH